MTISSLIEESIENPPVDQEAATIEGGAVTSPLARARYQAYVNLADTGREDGDGAAQVFNIDSVDSYHANLKAQELRAGDIAARQADMVALEQQILDSDMTPEATGLALRDLRASLDQGVDPEDLAVQELSARAMTIAEGANQEAIKLGQYFENEEKYSVARQLAETRQAVEADFAPTIPGLEWGVELLTSGMLFPKSSGTNVAGIIETMFPQIDAFQLAPGNSLEEAQALVATLSPEERVAAIKRGHDYLNKNAGILFDNEHDAMTMMNMIEGVFGNRIQGEAARVTSSEMQIFDTLLTLATSGVGTALVKGAKGLKKATPSASTPKVDRALEELTEPLVRQADNAAVEGAEGVVLGPRINNLPAPTKSQVLNDQLDQVLDGKPSTPRISVSIPHTGMPAFSPAQTLNDVAPEIAAPLLSEAFTDFSSNIAKGLGTTRAQIAQDTVVPRVVGEPIRRGASLLVSSISNSLSDAGANIRNLMHDSQLFTAGEMNRVEKELSGKLDSLVNRDEIVLVNKSEAYVDENTGKVSMNYVIGAGGDKTFETAADARAFITRLPTSRLDNFEVLGYQSQTGTYIPYAGPEDVLGDFVLKAKYTHTAASGAKKENVLRTSEASIFTNHVATSVSYIDRISKSISRLDIRQAQASSVFKKILKPMNDLKSKEDLDSVWDALKKAEKNEDDFTQGQLAQMLEGSQPRIEAYRAVRRFYQAVYETRNGMYRDFLSKKGFLTHTHNDGVEAWVKPIKDKAEISTVWWDEAGAIVSKDALKAKGIELDYLEAFSPKRHTDADGNIMETKYVAVRKGKTSLNPLPVQVLHNKKTYLGRHLDTQYVIEEMDDVISNGKSIKVGRVIAVANNPVDATKEAAKGEGRRARRSIETSNSDASFLEQELNQMHDLQMLTNTRHRMDFQQMDVTRQESIISPMESLDRVGRTMSKNVALNEWVEYNTNKWIATFGDIIEEKGFPWGGNINLKSSLKSTPELEARLKKARKYRERIQLTAGVHDAQLGEKFQQAALGTGEWLSRVAANTSKKSDAGLLRDMKVGSLNFAATAASKASTINPVQKAKALAHFSFITMNPIRQLLMQSTSMTMYAGVEHGTKYMASGRAGVDMAFLIGAKSWKDIDSDSFNTIVKQYAKLTGIKEKEAHKFFDDFDQSGTMGSVTSHQFLEHTFKSGGTYRNHSGTYATEEGRSVAGNLKHSMVGGVQTAAGLSSKYGFEAGEKMNRIVGYLAARNKHAVNGTLDGLSPTDLGVEGLRLAGDMGQYSKAAFQDGALGIPFQFMSHTTRMVQYMIPHTKWTSHIASDVMSNKEKAKVAVWQAVLFGGSGVGLGSLFADAAEQSGIEVDPVVHEALEEGLAGLALESIIEGMAGTGANLDISGTVAPLSGLTNDIQVVLGTSDRAATPLGAALRIAADVATGAPMNYSDLTGASSAILSKGAGIAGNIGKIWDNPVLGTGEKLEMQVRDIASFLPVVNNVLQARIMASTGEYVTKYGTPIAKVTAAEAFAKGLWGIGPEQVNDAFDLNSKLRGKRQVMEAPTHSELSRSGKDLANWTYNALRQLSSGTMSKQDIMNRIESANATVAMAYDNQTDKDIVRASMRKELVRLTGHRDTLADELVTLMASDYELSHEMGIDKVIKNIEKLGPSAYGDNVIQNLRRMHTETGEQ